MNIDLVGLWHALERLPFLFSITVFGLVLLTIAAFFIFPAYLLFRAEPRQIFQLLRHHSVAPPDNFGWRRILQSIANGLTAFNTVIGHVTAWLILFMTLMQFVVVIMRYVFAYGSIQMQESIWYMHGVLFMLGAGYTLVKDGHVRLDVFYRAASARTKAWVNLLGAVIFLLPFCILNFEFAWSLVLHSWAVREGSTETTGLPYVYLFKTVILVFSVVVAMEGVALALRSLLQLTARTSAELKAEE